MTYRIRFKQTEGAGEGEIVIEANSPTEAVVKFRCARGQTFHHVMKQEEITSVSDADMPDCMAW